MKNKPTINGVRVLKHGFKDASGKYFPAHCHMGELYVTPGSNITKNAVTIYARELLIGLPAELSPTNDSDSQTDYFSKDRAVFWEGSPEFETLKPFCHP